jgi:predicted nucleotide-binding protein
MKHIFIGSSTEASRHAEQIRDLLYQQQEVEPLLWIRLFQPGMLTFEAIERAAQKVVGAVLIASPDDYSVIRDKAVKVPRTNVMIEFGYFTAILGRRNITLCRYDGVELATF